MFNSREIIDALSNGDFDSVSKITRSNLSEVSLSFINKIKKDASKVSVTEAEDPPDKEDVQGTEEDPTLDPNLDREYFLKSFEEGDVLVTIKTVGVGKNKPVSVYFDDVRWEMFPGPVNAEKHAKEFIKSKQYDLWRGRKGLKDIESSEAEVEVKEQWWNKKDYVKPYEDPADPRFQPRPEWLPEPKPRGPLKPGDRDYLDWKDEYYKDPDNGPWDNPPYKPQPRPADPFPPFGGEKEVWDWVARQDPTFEDPSSPDPWKQPDLYPKTSPVNSNPIRRVEGHDIGESVNFLEAIDMTVGGKNYSVSIANTQESLQNGLMYELSMKKDKGILLVFENAERHGIWMKNTHIPLDVIWMTESGTIVDVKRLKPHDETVVYPHSPARYVLELNAGEYKGKIGDQVNIGDNTLLESSVLSSLNEISDRGRDKRITLKNGDRVKVNGEMAKAVLTLHEALNKRNKVKLEKMLNNSRSGFKKAIEFSYQNLRENKQ